MMVGTIDTTIASIATVTNSSISRYMTMSIINSSDDSYIVRMASSVGIVHRESMGNLAKGVGIRISLTLAIVTSVATMDTTIASIATVTNISISRYMAMAIINSSDDSDIVRMASSVGIGLRETVGNLANGVGIRISLTLAIEAMMVGTIDTTIASIATVTNSSISRYMTMSIINSSDDSYIVRMASSVGIVHRE